MAFARPPESDVPRSSSRRSSSPWAISVANRTARSSRCGHRIKTSRRSGSLYGRHEVEPGQYGGSADVAGMSPRVRGSSVRMRMAMGAINLSEVTVADGGRVIAFDVIVAGRVVKCTVSRESLQRYFWLQPDADDARMLKTFNDGRHRIVALA